jgi:hypothetical protein
MASWNTDRWVIQRNIDEYTKKIASEPDDVRRQQLVRLLEIERQNLQSLTRRA